MDEMAERIFSLLKKAKIEQKEFAKIVGTTDKTVSAWKTGRSKSYTKYLPQIAEVLGTSVEYLVTGEEKKPAPGAESGLDATKYHMLNEENRALVDQMIEKLLKSQSGE